MTLTDCGSPTRLTPDSTAWASPHIPPNGICVLSTTEMAGSCGLQAMLAAAALQRRDITEGHAGIPVTVALQLVDYDNQCAALHGAEVSIWHCNAEGLYADAEAGETFLRGVQYSNHAGCVMFKTIFPGSQPQQLARIHLQIVLPSIVPSSRTVSTANGQLCFPYPATITASGGPALPSEILTLSGDAHAGYRASSVIGITSKHRTHH